MNAIIGTTTTYHGTEHGYLNGYTVRIVGVYKGAAGASADADGGDEGAYLTDDQDIERAGGIDASDRIEVQPWLEREGRFSFVTSDPKARDMERFAEFG